MTTPRLELCEVGVLAGLVLNRKDHFDDVDFVFQYGYWEGGDEPVSSPRGR